MSDGDKVNVVNFSGGKDSTAMLFMMLERGVKVDRVVCVDTTKEFPAMYEHIEKVKKMCPVQIDIVRFDFDYWFGRHIKARGGNMGSRGYGFPDMQNRWCTSLKSSSVNRYMKKIKGDCLQFHGIAYDEKHRTYKNNHLNVRYPLVEWGVTEQEALEYCYSLGLDWGGLYEKFDRVSCWCCPLSKIGELRTLYLDFPELWEELEKMDEKSHRRFRADYSLSELTARFKKEGELWFLK